MTSLAPARTKPRRCRDGRRRCRPSWPRSRLAEPGRWRTRPSRRPTAVGCRDRATRVWDTVRNQLLAELPSVWDTARDQLLAELPSATPVAGDFTSASPAVSVAGDRAAIARGNAVEVAAGRRHSPRHRPDLHRRRGIAGADGPRGLSGHRPARKPRRSSVLDALGGGRPDPRLGQRAVPGRRRHGRRCLPDLTGRRRYGGLPLSAVKQRKGLVTIRAAGFKTQCKLRICGQAAHF